MHVRVCVYDVCINMRVCVFAQRKQAPAASGKAPSYGTTNEYSDSNIQNGQFIILS